MQRVFSSCVSDHAVFLSVQGDAYVYGCNKYAQCGMSTAAGGALGGSWLSDAVQLDRQRDFVPPLPNGVTVTAAATGAAHTLLLTSQGTVYAAGSNAQGQCGLAARPFSCPFHRVDGPFVAEKDPVIDMACGRAFSVLVTVAGHGTYGTDPLMSVYTMGSAEHGVLGQGLRSWHHTGPKHTQYYIQAEPARVETLKHITQVSCGEDHAVAYVLDG